jgi:hypothetical protein
MPEQFLVTEDEYRQLRRYDAHQPFMVPRARAATDALQILGMRVITPDHERWPDDSARWFNELRLALALSMSHADNSESMETPASALPDETLTCCGQPWPTHAAWMAHFREAHG